MMLKADIVKIGILSFAHMHAASYAASLAAHLGAELVGVWDADADRGQRQAEAFGTTFYASEIALLEQGLDGVIVTSENVHHRRLVELAAASGVKAILCEKPLAVSLEDGRAMIAACAAAGVSLATAFPCRYSPAYQRLRQQVQSGAIGDVLAIRGTNHGKMPGGWFTDPSLSGGGAVLDHAVHVADLNRHLLGQNAVEVYAEIGNGFYHQDWEDTGFLSIRYDRGVFATLDTSWSRPASYPTWGDVTLQVLGTQGVLELDMFAQNSAYYGSSGQTAAAWVSWGSDTDFGLIADFLKLAAGEPAPWFATGEDGLAALAVARAAYESAGLGTPAAVLSS